MAKFVNIHTHRPTGNAIEPTSAGIHPWHVGEGSAAEALPDIDEADAIGETGLDFACDSDRARQAEAFEWQLRLAEQTDKPVVIHCVRAFEPVMDELSRHSLRAVIFHGFIGSPEQAARALERGYYLLVRRPDVRLAQNRRGHEQYPVAADVSRNGRRSRRHRGDIRQSSRPAGHWRGGIARSNIR